MVGWIQCRRRKRSDCDCSRWAERDTKDMDTPTMLYFAVFPLGRKQLLGGGFIAYKTHTLEYMYVPIPFEDFENRKNFLLYSKPYKEVPYRL